MRRIRLATSDWVRIYCGAAVATETKWAVSRVNKHPPLTARHSLQAQTRELRCNGPLCYLAVRDA
jgi:hypothetical protein